MSEKGRKRGPKVKYDDEFHRVKRQLMKEYRRKWKEKKAHSEKH